jgi:hypothetical protein
MNDSTEPVPVEKTNSVDNAKSNAGWKIQLGVLCAMLLLALFGMGLSQASEKGAWEYWLFVVIVYAAFGLWRSTRRAKQLGQNVRALIGRELAHWGVLLAFLAVLLLLERQEIVDRQSASDFALMLLALTCCLAGIHFDWLLMIMGVVLTVMVVAMATLEQYSVVLWIIMILVAIAAAAFFYFKSKRGGSEAASIE